MIDKGAVRCARVSFHTITIAKLFALIGRWRKGRQPKNVSEVNDTPSLLTPLPIICTPTRPPITSQKGL